MSKRPRKETLFCLDDPKSPVAEGFRTLRTNIRYMEISRQIQTLLVTSALPGEGKTSTIAELGAALAQEGNKVLVIDGDLRKPTLHQKFGLSNDKGLSTSLINRCEIDEVISPTRQRGLESLPAGPVPPNPSELLGTKKMAGLIEALKKRYDIILLDSSPVLPVTDAQVLSKLADAVVMVIKAGRTSCQNVKKAKSLLDYVGANLIGVVINQKKVKQHDYHGYYR